MRSPFGAVLWVQVRGKKRPLVGLVAEPAVSPPSRSGVGRFSISLHAESRPNESIARRNDLFFGSLMVPPISDSPA